MQRRLIAVLTPGLFAVLALWLRPAPGVPLADPAVVSFRVRFGMTDREPRAWDGKLSVAQGEIIRLRNWHPRPADRIEGTSAFSLATWRAPNFRSPAPMTQPVTEEPVLVLQPGLIVDVKTASGAVVSFETRNGSFSFRTSDLAPGQPLRLLEGSVMVDRAPAAELVSGPESQDEFASIVAGENGEIWVAWAAYRDGAQANEVLARLFDGKAWGRVQKVTESPGDVFVVKLGRDGGGNVWAIWSNQVEGNFDLYARRFDGRSWSATTRLSEDRQPDIHHNVATDSSGGLWVVWQGFRSGKSDIFARRFDGSRWSEEEKLSTSAANDWAPAVAADKAGNVYVAWDTYDKGNYDVVMRRHANGRWSEPSAVADTPKFEAHVSLACDGQNRLWAAWNESGVEWGKDTGYALPYEGTPLYQWRSIAVAALEGERWQEPVTGMNEWLPAEMSTHNDLPVLQVDRAGRVWVFFRHRTTKIAGVPSGYEAHRATWEIFGAAYSGGAWSKPLALPFSTGRQDMRGGFTQDDRGNLYAAWPTDNRDYNDFLFEHADVYAARIPLPNATAEPVKLRARVQPKLTVYPSHPEEKKDLASIRGYEIVSGGKKYKIFRGDTHRHTEFSMDGHNDGSLEEAYRYAMDAAELDYLAVTEHNFIGGPNIDYIKWLLEQAVDYFHLPGRFTTVYAYERSVRFPNGHRNLLFARRGIPHFAISVEEYGGQPFPLSSDEVTRRSANPKPVGTRDLYAHLKKYNGISIPHTSATGMGTDWRDNDPDVEPLVEIYQGDRVSAEYEGAPRAAYASNPRSAPGGFRPEGYVWNAWAKGYKLGVQASSDHLSTHISYAATIAENGSREGLLAAMRKRHSYGATDNVILDFRLQGGGKEYLQGDLAAPGKDYRLSVRVIGTAPIRQIDIVRNKSFVHNRQNLGREASFTYVDSAPPAGESYYYVRVIQVDGQIAWSSPIWVDFP